MPGVGGHPAQPSASRLVAERPGRGGQRRQAPEDHGPDEGLRGEYRGGALTERRASLVSHVATVGLVRLAGKGSRRLCGSLSITGTASVVGVILWLNGTHGVGKTTTGALVQQLVPDSRVFDAEKVGETLMDITPGLPETDNFQHWPPWRPLVVDTARRVLDYTGGTLVMPMTVLVQRYWREISTGFAQHAIPVRHFVLHADQETLRARIAGDTVLGPDSPFRLSYVRPYAEASRDWLHAEAEVVDTTGLSPLQVARRIADALDG